MRTCSTLVSKGEWKERNSKTRFVLFWPTFWYCQIIPDYVIRVRYASDLVCTMISILNQYNWSHPHGTPPRTKRWDRKKDELRLFLPQNTSNKTRVKIVHDPVYHSELSSSPRCPEWTGGIRIALGKVLTFPSYNHDGLHLRIASENLFVLRPITHV